MPEIKIENVTVTYPLRKYEKTIALDGFSASFADECFNTVLGYSGCGKTTLLKAIAGLVDYEGKVFYDQTDAAYLSVKDRNIAMVNQESTLFPALTVFENIASPLKAAGAGREEIVDRVREVAQVLDLSLLLTRKPRQLSGGQQQLVAIARALVKRPAICLLDEPFSNLDLPRRDFIGAYIKKLAKSQGCTVIYVTHDVKEAILLGDRLYVIHDGRLLAEGEPNEVMKLDHPVLESLRGEID